LREIADDMEAFRHFGMAITNHISCTSAGARFFIQVKGPPGALPFPLPDKPPQPIRLEYKSSPIPFR